MVTYIVRLTVRYEIYDEYVEWMKSEHIPDVLALPGFLGAELCLRKGGSMESSSKDIQVHYKLKDEEHMRLYMTEYALKYREKGLEKFPGQFSAQREVWLETSNFTTKETRGLSFPGFAVYGGACKPRRPRGSNDIPKNYPESFRY